MKYINCVSDKVIGKSKCRANYSEENIIFLLIMLPINYVNVFQHEIKYFISKLCTPVNVMPLTIQDNLSSPKSFSLPETDILGSIIILL